MGKSGSELLWARDCGRDWITFVLWGIVSGVIGGLFGILFWQQVSLS